MSIEATLLWARGFKGERFFGGVGVNDDALGVFAASKRCLARPTGGGGACLAREGLTSAENEVERLKGGCDLALVFEIELERG